MLIGTKIYDLQGNLRDLIENWRFLNFNTIFASTSLYSNLEFRQLAKDNDMTVFVIFPVFYNPEALEMNPGLYSITNEGKKAIEEWVRFVCPSRKEFRVKKIAEIKKNIVELDPDGLSLDFIRYFVYWEKIYPERILDSIPNCCFCSCCLKKFQEDTEVLLPDNITDIRILAKFILNNYVTEWTNWKCDTVYSLIQEITEEVRKIKPKLLINAHIVPWRKDDFGGAIKKIAGQDLKKIAKIVDFVSPMCYSHMLKRNPSWISDVVQDMYEQTKDKIVPSIQVEKCYLKAEISKKEFGQMITEAIKAPSEGVIFWSWEMIQKNTERKKQVKKSLFSS